MTLLFTDVEGSTQLLRRLGTERYAEALELHRRLLRGAFARHGGFEVGTEGDSFFVTFERAERAIAAAGEAQKALATAVWPDGEQLRVRMGLHTGEPAASGGNYVGMDVHQAARVMSAGHGGQVLVSEATSALVDGVALRDLGPHRLKDLLAPIRLYQLELDGLPGQFPPLRSLRRTNLPIAAWPLLGRERELGAIRSLLSEGARLVTLTGPGGSGKTRLALQAAAELAEEFADGVFFVALAPLRDTFAVRATVAEAVGLQPDDDVAAWLASRRTLLVLDNLEHLPGVDAVAGELLVGETAILATSRMPLRLSIEHEVPVGPLDEQVAVELFVSRAAAAGRALQASDLVAAVCRRLDNLPLALELAAARARLLSPATLLERLDRALPLLTGGASDRPERQRTLRATIAWSYDLLDSDAQAAYRRLSVFRGSFTLDAAEAVADAHLDQIAALLDQSLLQPLGDDRFFLLETLREYAREQLDGVDGTDEYSLRHARWYLDRVEGSSSELLGQRRSEPLAWIDVERDNLRAMLDRLASADRTSGARAAFLLSHFWMGRGAYSEDKQWLVRFLEDDDAGPQRAGLLYRLCQSELELGNYGAAERAGREACELAEASGSSLVLVEALGALASVASRRGHHERSIVLARRGLEVAGIIGDEEQTLLLMHRLGSFLGKAQRSNEAITMIRSTYERARLLGVPSIEMASLLNLGWMELNTSREYETARDAFRAVLDRNREFDSHNLQANGLLGLGFSLLGLNQRIAARRAFAEVLQLLIEAAQTGHVALTSAASGIALAAEPGHYVAAARLRGAVATLRRGADYEPDPNDIQLEEIFERRLIETVGEHAWERELAVGATMSFDEAITLARSIADAPETVATPE